MKAIFTYLLTLSFFSSAFGQGLIPFRQNQKWGLADSLKKMVVPCQYDGVRVLDSERYLVRKDGLWQLLDKKGNLVTTQKYEGVSKLNDSTYFYFFDKTVGLGNKYTEYQIKPVYNQLRFVAEKNIFEAYLNEKVGFLDTKGNVLIPVQYESIRFLNQNLLALYKNQGYQIGTKDGKILSEKTYEDVIPLQNGFFLIKEAEKWGCLDSKGNVVIAPKFNQILPFDSTKVSVLDYDKKGIYDNKGNEILPPLFENEIYQLSNQKFWVKQKQTWVEFDAKTKKINKFPFDNLIDTVGMYFRVTKGDKMLLADQTGKAIFPEKYYEVKPYNRNLFIVQLDKKWGFTDKKGKLVSKLHYDEIYDIRTVSQLTEREKAEEIWGFKVPDAQAVKKQKPNEGLNKVRIENKWALIDATGKELTTFEFDEIRIRNIEEPLAIRKGQKFGAADLSGKVVLLPIYDNIEWNAATKNYIIFEDGKKGLANQYGTVLIKPKYDFLNTTKTPNRFIVKDGDLWNVVDTLNQKIFKQDFERVAEFEKYFQVIQNQAVGLYTTNGEEVIKPAFENIIATLPAQEKAFLSIKKGKYGIISQIGKEILPAQYDEIRHASPNWVWVKKDGLEGFVRLSDAALFFEDLP